MGRTDYPGIDYSLGQANRDPETGIHYGVINANRIPHIWDDAEPEYHKGCPHCGNDLDDEYESPAPMPVGCMGRHRRQDETGQEIDGQPWRADGQGRKK
jgi:hypothetical protein